jgi:succinate dehydrogenase / fumarate reductase membrane anchor subunit
MSYRTPLARVRGLGSAKSGAEHWWMQRVTAVANIPLIVFLLAFVLSHLGSTRAELIASVKHPAVAVGLILAFLSVLWHMRLGMQVIIEDYVHGPLKLVALIANSFFAITVGALALYAVGTMSLGG